MAFIIGDRVTWTSQSGGYRKTKSGLVVAIVPPGQVPGGVYNCGLSRDHVSYVVKTDDGRLRWPRVKHLIPATA